MIGHGPVSYTRIRMLRNATVAARCAVLFALALPGQETETKNRLGLPNPPKQDVPFLIHGSEILELEQAEAQQEENKNQLVFWIPGAAASVKTPLAAPEFLIDSKDIDPRDLKLYGFDVSKGRREILYRKKKKIVAEPYFLQLDGIEARVVRIRTGASLAPGEYALTPDGSNAVFTFAVF